MGDMNHNERERRKEKREQFANDLMGFHAAVGTPLIRLPTINGREVDLLGLYEAVTGLGGWERVSDNSQWPEVVAQLELPDGCVNSSVAFKQIYLRYLDKYEKTHFVHKVRGETEDEMDFNIRRMNKQSARTLYTIPTIYNDDQHNLTEEQRTILGLNAVSERDKYEKIQLSLNSPLPNEQDFAINVCSLLSLNPHNNPIDLRVTPRLLINLLAHAGVFTDVYFRDFLCENYEKTRGYDVKNFWRNSLRHDALAWMTNESNFTKKDDDEDIKLVVELPERNYMTETLVNSDRFVERICQVARVVLNLAQNHENACYLAREVIAVRFMLLCCDCRYKKISELGWEIFISLAGKLCLRTLGFKEICLLVKDTIISEDISEVLASLRVLCELTKVDTNLNDLILSVDQELFSKLCTYLTLQDVVIILCTLDALYALSSLDRVFCDSIVQTTGVLSILILLLKFRVPFSATFGTWRNIRVLESVFSEDGTQLLGEKDLGALSVKPPELPYPYYVSSSISNVPPAIPEQFKRIESPAPACCVLGECRRLPQNNEATPPPPPLPPPQTPPPNKDVITLTTSPVKTSLLCSALRNSGVNGVKPIAVSTVGPAVTLKTHLEEPVTKIIKISNPGSHSLHLKSPEDSLKSATKKIALNGKEFDVATPLSPPNSKSEESNSSNSDDMQVTSNHIGNDENSMPFESNGDIKEELTRKFAVKSKIERVEKVEKHGMVNGIQEEVKVNGVQVAEDYLCEWRGCLRKFKTANAVFAHINSLHCPQTMLEGACVWGSCSAGKMVYKILMKHIEREHCNPEIMLPIRAKAASRPRSKLLMARNRFAVTNNIVPPTPPSTPLPPGIMMAPTPEQFMPSTSAGSPLMPPPPPQHHPPPQIPHPPPQFSYLPPPRFYGPPPVANTPAGDKIAESVRLTSALILRNVASACPTARQRLLRYEQQIVEAAALDSEASRAAAECLSYLWT